MKGRMLGLTELLKPFLIYTGTFLGELKAPHIWKSYGWDRLHSRSHPILLQIENGA